MSDDREASGAIGDGEDITDAGRGQTALAVRPLRPAGKRSRQAAEDAAIAEEGEAEAGVTKAGTTTKVKAAKKAGRPGWGVKGRPNPFAFVLTYLRQVVAELRKVIWPNRKQMIGYTVVVMVFLAFMSTVIALVDLGMAKLMLLVLG